MSEQTIREFIEECGKALSEGFRNALSAETNDIVINVLGTKYVITYVDERDNDNGGEVDLYNKLIKVYTWKNEKNVSNKDKIMKHCLRHEIIHAFLFESGLNDNCFNQADSWPANEEMIDWFAIQYPKIKAIFQEMHIED